MIVIRILYLINYAGSAGTEKYVKLLVDSYDGDDNKCFLAYNIDGPLAEYMKDRKIKTFQFEMRHPFDISAAKRLAEFCKRNKIDVIHAQYQRENTIAVLSRIFNPSVKVVFTNHLTTPAAFLWKNFIYRISTKFNHKIICVCNKSKEIFAGCGINYNKLVVIFNGIKMNDNKKTVSIREEFGISKDTFLMISVARFSPEKGLEFLIDSVKQLSSMCEQKFKLLIVGSGDLFYDIKEKVSSEGLSDLVILTGYRTDVESFLKECDLFINSASGSEALSFAMLEALSNKVPLIATDVGGNSDIVNKGTNCGMLVEYGHTMEMALSIKDIMTNPELHKRMANNAQKAVENVFDLDIMLKKTYEQYL